MKRPFAFLFFISTLAFSTLLNAQPSTKRQYPEIGKPCPEFVLNNIHYYSRSTASLKQLQSGKPIILDFFTDGCATCVKSFPKVNDLQNKFNNQVQFMLIGETAIASDLRTNGYKTVKKFYERFKEKMGLELCVAYDSTVYKNFVHNGVPHVVWIDKNGIVQAITNSEDLTEENIDNFINSKKFSFKDASYKESLKGYRDRKLPLYVNGNGSNGDDADFLYRSLLAESKPFVKRATPLRLHEVLKISNKVEVTSCPVSLLYTLAYTGYAMNAIWLPTYDEYGTSSPIFEIKDTSLLSKVFTYSLIAPKEKATVDFMMRKMQRDLEDYFDLEVTVELKKVPCWQLVASEEAKIRLPTKGGPRHIEDVNHMDFVGTNVPLRTLLELIWTYNQTEPVFVDMTGITSNIDINLKASFIDFEEVRTGLKSCGLDLIKGEVERKVITVRNKSK